MSLWPPLAGLYQLWFESPKVHLKVYWVLGYRLAQKMDFVHDKKKSIMSFLTDVSYRHHHSNE